jgi:hypothetical protein
MLAQMLLVLLGSIVLGVVLLVLGLRGKRLNTNPICRDCAFDLVAVPEGTITCPECGAGLKRPNAIRIGARRKRPVFLGVAGLLILLPLAPLGTAAYGVMTGQDLNKWKPLGLLLWEAKRARGPGAQGIAAELLNRYSGTKLSEEQSGRIVQTALTVQGDTGCAWAAEWADIIEAAEAKKGVSKDDLARFRRQAPVLEFRSRARVVAGQPIPVLVKLKEGRIGSNTSFMSMVALKSAKLGDKTLKRAKPPSTDPYSGAYYAGPQIGYFYLHGPKSRWGWNQSFGEAGLMLSTPADLAPGRYTLELAVVTETKSQGGTVHWSGGIPKGKDAKEHTISLPVEIVAERDAIEKVAPSPEMEKKFQLALNPSQTMVWHNGQTLGAQQHFSMENLPAPVAFDVFWKEGEREWKIGALTSGKGAQPNAYWAPGGEDSTRLVQGSVPGLKGRKVDVIFRPNEEALVGTLDQMKMYDGEIVLKDVEVQRQDAGVSQNLFSMPGASLIRNLFGR